MLLRLDAVPGHYPAVSRPIVVALLEVLDVAWSRRPSRRRAGYRCASGASSRMWRERGGRQCDRLRKVRAVWLAEGGECLLARRRRQKRSEDEESSRMLGR